LGKSKENRGKLGSHSLCTTVGKSSSMMRKGKKHPSTEIPNKRKTPSFVGEGFVVDTDDDESSSPTPTSLVNRARTEGTKKAKNKSKRANGDEGARTNRWTT
jgi:hypothetical protein